MDFKAKRSERIFEAQELLSELQAQQLEEITPYQKDGKRRPLIIWKADGLVYAALARLIDLGHIAVELWGRESFAAAFLVGRAMMETTACLHSFAEGLKSRMDSGCKYEELDEFIMRHCFGSRTMSHFPQAFSVLTHIDRLDKLIPGFRCIYDQLSEVCHPNYPGNLGAYSDVDKAYVIRIKQSDESIGFMDSHLPIAINGSLELMQIVFTNYDVAREILFCANDTD
ncbi:MAG: hypothetical protein P4N41_12470 [Negativicutes bacterium]|nr:hypothetical protein [Negativicutes bacterium]